MKGEVYRLPTRGKGHDLNRLTEPVAFLSVDEMQRIDQALALVLDL